MSTYKHLPRQKTKLRNNIVTWLDIAHHWFNMNWRIVVAGIVSVAILSTIVVVVSNYISKGNEKASFLFYSAAKLEGDAAIAKLEEVISAYPRSKVAKLARLKLFDIFYTKQDYKKAEETIAPTLTDSNPLIRTLSLHNMAVAKLGEGDAAGAAEDYLKAYKYSKNPIKGLSYFNAAMAFKSVGKLEDAKKIFEELSKDDTDFSTPDLREKSKEQLIWMAANR